MDSLTNTQRCLSMEPNFPVLGGPEEKFAFLIKYAILSPSVRNSQPWDFRVEGNALTLFLDDSKNRRAGDPDTRELIISCGCALQHLHIAARRFGLDLEVNILPDGFPGKIATVRLLGEKAVTEPEVIMFYAIHKWLNIPQPFRATSQVPENLRKELTRMANDGGVWLHITEEPSSRDTLAGLVVEGDRLQKSDEDARKREAAASGRPDRRQSPWGQQMSEGAGHIAAYIESFLKRPWSAAPGKRMARKLAEEAPLMVVLGTTGDEPSDWIAAGRMLASVLLRSLAVGVRASLLNPCVGIPEVRRRISSELGLNGYPQVVFRLGFPSPGTASGSTKNGELQEQYL